MPAAAAGTFVIRALCCGAALIGVTWLALILFTLLYNGVVGLNARRCFTENTPPPGSTSGGLLNAIVGSLIMTAIGVGIGAPLGLFAGTYLAEYGKHDRLTSVIRFINDILLSAPSIIIGLFIYGAVVVPMRGFSAIAGCARARRDRDPGRAAHHRGHAGAGAQSRCARRQARSACRARS